jgi:hypothetical protein
VEKRRAPAAKNIGSRRRRRISNLTALRKRLRLTRLYSQAVGSLFPLVFPPTSDIRLLTSSMSAPIPRNKSERILDFGYCLLRMNFGLERSDEIHRLTPFPPPFSAASRSSTSAEMLLIKNIA